MNASETFSYQSPLKTRIVFGIIGFLCLGFGILMLFGLSNVEKTIPLPAVAVVSIFAIVLPCFWGLNGLFVNLTEVELSPKGKQAFVLTRKFFGKPVFSSEYQFDKVYWIKVNYGKGRLRFRGPGRRTFCRDSIVVKCNDQIFLIADEAFCDKLRLLFQWLEEYFDGEVVEEEIHRLSGNVFFRLGFAKSFNSLDIYEP